MRISNIWCKLFLVTLTLGLFIACPGPGGQNANQTPSPSAAQTPATGNIQGTVVGTEGEPLAGVNVLLNGTARTATTGADGGFKFDNVAAGKAALSVEQTRTPESRDKSTPAAEKIKVDVVQTEVGANATITLRVRLTTRLGLLPVPPCVSIPLCFLSGTTVGRLVVVAGGGKSPPNSPDPVTITVTDPIGDVFNPPQPPGTQTFDPGRAGPWKVEVTVCGKTVVCESNLP